MSTSGNLDPFSAHQDYASSAHLWLLAQHIAFQHEAAAEAARKTVEPLPQSRAS